MDKTYIGNLAISHLGIGSEIKNVETEQTPEAKAIRLFFDRTVDAFLREFAWPFGRKFRALELVENDPTDEWKKSYRYPNDCLMIRRVKSGLRNDTRQSRVPYLLGVDNQGKLIYCDSEEAEIEYTSTRAREIHLWDPDFELAFSYRLASVISPRITKGDPFKVGEKAFQLMQYSRAIAQANAGNEEQAEEKPDSEFINVRA